jgi:hypothetical protein
MALASLGLPAILDSGRKHPRCFSASFRLLCLVQASSYPRCFSASFRLLAILDSDLGILDAVGLFEDSAYPRWRF